MADDITITIHANDQTARAFRDVNGRLRDMRGRFVSESAIMQRSMAGLSASSVKLAGSLLPLATAAAPLAAALAPIAVQAGAAGSAVGAFAAAVIPQVQALKDATEAQTKYTDAVDKYGPASKQAADAQKLLQQSLDKMPPATRQAAGAFFTLKDSFKSWSDGLAQFTMVPVTRGLQLANAMLPKFSPLVESASLQLSRLTAVAGGAIASPGFDALMNKFNEFADRSLQRVTDGVIHFARVLSSGQAKGPISQFMDYARQNGPALKETLTNVGEAVTHLLEASAAAGPGMLSLVNAFAQLVAAVPPGFLAVLMQTATAFKLIQLAGAGIGGVAGGVARLQAAITGLTAASAAAGGGLAGLRAAFLSLGATARATVVVGALVAVAAIMTKLSDIGRAAPPDVDRMTTAIAKLGDSGKMSGEAVRVLGSDLGTLSQAIGVLDKPSVYESVDRFLVGLLGMESTPDKGANAVINSLDQALTNLVKGGKADLAKAALDQIVTGMEAQGKSTAGLTGHLKSYQSALDDAALESQLTAQSMGLFGEQALLTSQKLADQKSSADGLRQAIQALNDVNRAGLGGMIGFEAAIDAAAESAKKNAGALSMSHGQLDLNSKKAQDAATALNDLAAKTDEAATSARESGSSWSTVNGIYDRGRSKLISAAEAMGLTRAQARQLAAQILKTPDKTARLKGNLEDLETKLADAKRRLDKAPKSKTTKIRGEISDLSRKIADAKANLNLLTNKNVTISANLIVNRSVHDIVGKAAGGIIGAYANGGATGSTGALALVGEQGPELVKLPYGSTVYPAGQSERMIDDGAPVRAFARGGTVTAAERQARSQALGEFGISAFGRQAGYRITPFERSLGSPGTLGDLVASLNRWRGIIKAATSGLAESRLLKALNSTATTLITNQKALARVNGALDKARDKLSSLKDAAAQLSSSVASGIIGGANITGTAQATGLTSTGRILDQLTMDRDKAAALAQALKTLKGRGLNAQSLAEIAQAGVSGGGLATAEALMSASASDIKQINALERQLKASAAAAGKVTADAMYGAGIKAADGLVKGLEKQQKRLDAVMERAAKALERAIERAFKRKAHGGIVGAAAGGARGGLTWVGEQGPELARLPYGTTVYPAGQSRAMAGGAAPSQEPIVINLSIGGRAFEQIWVDTGRRAVRTRGGNVDAVLAS